MRRMQLAKPESRPPFTKPERLVPDDGGELVLEPGAEVLDELVEPVAASDADRD